MLNKFRPVILAAFLALASGCAKENAALPAPKANAGSANYIAPYDDGSGNTSGGGSGTGTGTTVPCTAVAPTSTIKAYIARNVQLTAAANNWTIVTTITPPDGITYGLGCNNVYPCSVDVIVTRPDGTTYSTYASGTYNYNTKAFYMSL